MVSVEFAAALPAVVLVLLVVLSAVRVGIDQIRTTDAARVAVRAAARADTASQVDALVARDGPPGASVAVSHDGGSVTVSVSAPVRGPAAWVTGGRALHASVTAPLEASSGSPVAGSAGSGGR